MKLFLHLVVSVKMDSYSKGNNRSMKGVFLGENHILDNVCMSLDLSQEIANTSMYRYCLYLRNKYYGRAPSVCTARIKKRLGKRKWKCFFPFLFPSRYPVKSIDAPVTSSRQGIRDVCAIFPQVVCVSHWQTWVFALSCTCLEPGCVSPTCASVSDSAGVSCPVPCTRGFSPFFNDLYKQRYWNSHPKRMLHEFTWFKTVRG
jgi:hypothetical protein